MLDTADPLNRPQATMDRYLERWGRLIARRFRRRPLLPFLLLATVVLTMVVTAFPQGRVENELGLALTVAEIGLLGVWAGRLRSGWDGRLLVATTLVVFVSVLWSSTTVPDPVEVLTVFLGFYVAVALLSALSQLGYRLLGGGAANSKRDLQFSLSGVIAALTITCIASATLRLARIPNGDPIEMVLSLGSWALLPILAHQLVAATRRWWLAAAGVMLVAVVSAVCFVSAVRYADEMFWYTLGQGVFIGVWLIGLKVRNRPIERQPAEPPVLKVVSETDNEDAAEDGAAEEIPEQPPASSIDLNG